MFELLTLSKRAFHTEDIMQLSFNKEDPNSVSNLSELRTGEKAVLERIDLPEETAKRLMELGFVPGHVVEPALSAPGGEPRVYRVDGSEIAIRRETARHLLVRKRKPAHPHPPQRS